MRVVVAQSVGNWTEKRRVVRLSPSAHKTWKLFWLEGKVPKHLQRTAKVSLSKVPNPKIFTYCLVMSWRQIQGWTVTLPVVYPPQTLIGMVKNIL